MDIDKNDFLGTTTQTIRITQTSSFYNQNYPSVSGATISITNQAGVSVASFTETTEAGVYEATDFATPNIGEIYTLNIIVNGETYTAEDTYTSIVDINEINQEDFPSGPPGEEIIQVNVNVNNEIGVDNYYLFQVDRPTSSLPEYANGDDGFISEEEGDNDFDLVYFHEVLDEEETNNVSLTFTLYGISQAYNNYLTKLLALAQESRGPFSTAPATVRGNFSNTTQGDNYALGFFSLNQYVKENYLVE